MVTLKKYGRVSEPEFKWLCYFDDEAYRNLMEFARYFLCHVNPHTGLALKDDPAFICLSLVNESSLMIRVHQLTGKTRPVMEKAFAEWCKTGNKTGDRDALMNKFLTEKAKNFYEKASRDLRNMGVKIPLTDQNMVFHIPTQMARLDYDYVDSHFYWGHPRKMEGQSFQVPVQSITSDWTGELRDSVAIRIFGKPNVITEWNFCHPNPRSAEEQIIMPALCALQGFDGLWHFCYAHANTIDKMTPIGSFDILFNPVKRLGVRMGTALFLRRDVSESAVSLSYRPDRTPSGFAQLSAIAKVGMANPADSETTRTAVPGGLQSEDLVLKLMEENRIPKSSYDAVRKIARSTTGELELNHKERIFTVRSPRCEAYVLSAGRTASGKFLSDANKKQACVIAITSLDDKPLRDAKRLLLLHLTENKNEGTVYVAPEMSIQERWGTSKILVKRGIAEVWLNSRRIDKIYACDIAGKRLFEVPFTKKDGMACFTADVQSKAGVVMVYEVVQK